MSMASSAATGGSVSSIENDDISLSSSKYGGDGVGVLFDGSLPSAVKKFTFCPQDRGDSGDVVYVELECVDDEPGAVQSGHYLWPASPALSRHLVDTYGTGTKGGGDDDKLEAKKEGGFHMVVELGAGCGLAALTAMQVFRRTATCVAVTDFDPNTLTRARHNHNKTLEKLAELFGGDSSTREESPLSFPTVVFEEFRWGDSEAPGRLADLVALETGGDVRGDATDGNGMFDLVLISDAIYATEVVRPLMESASQLMSRTKESEGGSSSSSLIIMCQSFAYDEKTEEAIDAACDECGLTRSVLSDALGDGESDANEGAVKIQTFRFRQ